MEIKNEAWTLSKTIIGLLLTMLISVSVYNYKQQDGRISALEAYAIQLDKEKIGKPELKEAVASINSRMDAMVNTLNTVQQIHSQNVLNRIDTQQAFLNRLEAHILTPKN